MAVCYLGIGSNLGNKRLKIRAALKRIEELKDTKVLKVSKLIKTKPVGGPCGQPDYLNACLKIDTRLTPHTLLKKLQDIEIKLGRSRKHVRFGPRTIDLDILFYGNSVVNTRKLTIPHPRVFERQFVLKPLREIL
ncbi:MAG: 2-amino-4-hydroxy-6-hydroxymethyldihydropteridine diphosphokinase [Candidatus Omnitrophica bacterium]|nr:2-amino-4-hydroxy-6-hydroxymethyldihydropteridine diphosphokinase [Candidatus Omnitrophota bacterium]